MSKGVSSKIIRIVIVMILLMFLLALIFYKEITIINKIVGI